MHSYLQKNYDHKTIIFHWVTVILILLMWGNAHTIDWFPIGAYRVDARSTHIIFGVILGALTIYRIIWRLRAGTRFVDPRTPLWTLAKGVHYALYALIIATIALGLFNAWVRGDSLFNIMSIPPFDNLPHDARHALGKLITTWHRWGANSLLILGAAHGTMGLVHHYILRDDILRRMIPQC